MQHALCIIHDTAHHLLLYTFNCAHLFVVIHFQYCTNTPYHCVLYVPSCIPLFNAHFCAMFYCRYYCEFYVPYTTLLNIYYYTYLVVFNISYITAPHVHLMHIYESCVSAHLYISYVTAHHVYHCSYIVCQSTSCIPLLILIIGPCFTVIVYCTFYVPCFTAHFLLPILYTIVNYIAFVVLSY